jgi:hypothetical protein
MVSGVWLDSALLHWLHFVWWLVAQIETVSTGRIPLHSSLPFSWRLIIPIMADRDPQHTDRRGPHAGRTHVIERSGRESRFATNNSKIVVLYALELVLWMFDDDLRSSDSERKPSDKNATSSSLNAKGWSSFHQNNLVEVRDWPLPNFLKNWKKIWNSLQPNSPLTISSMLLWQIDM